MSLHPILKRLNKLYLHLEKSAKHYLSKINCQLGSQYKYETIYYYLIETKVKVESIANVTLHEIHKTLHLKSGNLCRTLSTFMEDV